MAKPKLHIVETQSIHRIVYVVSTSNLQNAVIQNHIDRNELAELGQEWFGEKIVSVYACPNEEGLLKKYKELNREIPDINKTSPKDIPITNLDVTLETKEEINEEQDPLNGS